ncbi:MAG: GNAT family N-acetyltransferase [Nocardioides marinisabuli]|uniref:GNAT family N-acetyltransferase n=1 Tax=Nocardioides marinisabuli TaxID=419476 RepID=UPI00321AC5C4
MDLVALGSADLDHATRAGLRALWDLAFPEGFSDEDEAHAYGGVHVLVRADGDPVAHASAVPRRIRFGPTWHTVAYVEAVATHPAHRGRGLGRAVMQRLHDEIAGRWPVAMLSTGSATGFYERLGWERWQGTSYTRTPTGTVADGEQDGLMILRLDPLLVPDLRVHVVCEDRPGDAW